MKVEMLMQTKLSNMSPNMHNFKTDQVWYESKDGTKVPMFIVRKKSVLPDINQKPKAPLTTILYGYGGFKTSEVPFFNLFNLIFLNNMNGMFVVANIRGGGEFGDNWHK
jgi:prolyl oligopeptidase